MLNHRVRRNPVSRSGRVSAILATVAASTVLAAFGAAAQTGTVLSGTVVDAMGRGVPRVTLVLVDLRGNGKHEVRADASGGYSFVPLPAGDYKLAVSQPGFAAFGERITLAGDRVQRTIALQLGSVQETIKVTDAPVPPPPAPVPVGQAGRNALPPPPAPLTTDELRKRVRAKRASDPCAQSSDGGCILPPLKLKDVKPVFPESLKGRDGDATVELKGVIATDGFVRGLQVVNSPHPDLSNAAIAAVSQWEFEPTQLDGVVVETGIGISVTFAKKR